MPHHQNFNFGPKTLQEPGLLDKKKEDSNRVKQHFADMQNSSVSDVTFLGKCNQVLGSGSFSSTLQFELKQVFKTMYFTIQASILQLNEIIIAPPKRSQVLTGLVLHRSFPPSPTGVVKARGNRTGRADAMD